MCLEQAANVVLAILCSRSHIRFFFDSLRKFCSTNDIKQPATLWPAATPDFVSILNGIIYATEERKTCWKHRGVDDAILQTIQERATHWLSSLDSVKSLEAEVSDVKEETPTELQQELSRKFLDAKRNLFSQYHVLIDALRLPNTLLSLTPLDSTSTLIHSSKASSGSVTPSQGHAAILQTAGLLEFCPSSEYFFLSGPAATLSRSVEDHVFKFVQSYFHKTCLLCCPPQLVKRVVAAELVEPNFDALLLHSAGATIGNEDEKPEIQVCCDPVTSLLNILMRQRFMPNSPFPFVLFSPKVSVYTINDRTMLKDTKETQQHNLYETGQSNCAVFLRCGRHKTGLQNRFQKDSVEFFDAFAKSIGEPEKILFEIRTMPVSQLRSSEMARFHLDIYSPWLQKYVTVASCGCFGDYFSKRLQIVACKDWKEDTERIEYLTMSYGVIDLVKLFAVLVDNFGLELTNNFVKHYPNSRYNFD